MKKFLIVFVLALYSIHASASDYSKVINGILLIGSDSKDFNFKTPDKKGGTINYNLELYTNGSEKQYSLGISFDRDKNCAMIPSFGTLLIKTSKGDVLDLKALFVYDNYEGDTTCQGYFPITEEQLNLIIESGVAKFRLQMITGEDSHETFAEKEWKTDELGKNYKSMLAHVNKKCEKLKTKYLASQKSIDSEF